MSVTIEFYGIPRERAGIEKTTVDGSRLGEVLAALAARYPSFGENCLDGIRLRLSYVANLNGERFVSDPETPLRSGDTLLILAADAGG